MLNSRNNINTQGWGQSTRYSYLLVLEYWFLPKYSLLILVLIKFQVLVLILITREKMGTLWVLYEYFVSIFKYFASISTTKTDRIICWTVNRSYILQYSHWFKYYFYLLFMQDVLYLLKFITHERYFIGSTTIFNRLLQ